MTGKYLLWDNTGLGAFDTQEELFEEAYWVSKNDNCWVNVLEGPGVSPDKLAEEFIAYCDEKDVKLEPVTEALEPTHRIDAIDPHGHWRMMEYVYQGADPKEREAWYVEMLGPGRVTVTVVNNS
jgi:hypothetical protein